jgi:hypothetical protein
MPETKTRPALQRKHTRTTDAKAQAELDAGVRITFEGETYEVRFGDITSTIARQLRTKTGMSFNALMREISVDPDADTLAAFMWLSRRLAGEDVEIDDVVVTYRQILLDEGFEVAVAGQREDEDGPEG